MFFVNIDCLFVVAPLAQESGFFQHSCPGAQQYILLLSPNKGAKQAYC